MGVVNSGHVERATTTYIIVASLTRRNDMLTLGRRNIQEPEIHSTRAGSERIGSQRPFELGGVVYEYYTNKDRLYARGLINLMKTKRSDIFVKNLFCTNLISDG